MSILKNIHGHEDLKQLSAKEQTVLCDEIRSFLIENISKTGGHLASNLGVVELTLAIETVYNTHKDRLVFDVGHQSYVHKLLTGRQADFTHLRQFGGMAGFPKPSESDADAFVAGHASSSVSVALGMARARTLLGADYDVVTVIGDGAVTGGMAYEGLNDAAVSGEPMVIILNDNEMSISPNVGGIAQHLSRLRTEEKYLNMKQRYRSALTKSKLGRSVYHGTRNVKEWLKKALLETTLFENMGLTYLGPVDGHDVQGLITLLHQAKTMKRPVLLHVHTQKGRGYAPAEKNPAQYHGIGKFDIVSGLPRGEKKVTFSDVFGNTMVQLACEHKKLCAITAAMPDGTGLLNFMAKFPDRTFDVGIAEEHAVSMAGGLAKQGMVPVVALYSTFLQRSYDQILQDVTMLNLHVVLAIDRAGLVGEDGETHHGVFDVGFLRQTPGMCILCPVSTAELGDMLRWAVNECNGPIAVRYPRGGDGQIKTSDWDANASIVFHRNGHDGLILTYGRLTNEALGAAEILSRQGVEIAVARLMRLDALADDVLEEITQNHGCIMIAEEAIGGIAQSLALQIKQVHSDACVRVADLGRTYAPHGETQLLYRHYGLDAQSLANRILEVRKGEN